LRRSGAYQPQAGWAGFYARVFTALLAMGLALWSIDPGAARWIAMQSQPLVRAAWLGGIVSAGGLVYFCVLWALGFRIRDFKRTV
jgi:putative peptidoglycan lipid II flippase